jgi:hypothetical protein
VACRLHLAIFLLVAAPGQSLGQPVLFDPDYSIRPTQQRDGVVRRIDRIVAPTLTFPALVRTGGRFLVELRVTVGADGKPLAVAPVERYEVDLLVRGEQPPLRCVVRGATRHGGLLRLEVEVPAALARDLYDLHVMGPGVADRQPSAVRIYGGGPPDRFRFGVVSDHQLWDPSYRISGRALNAGLYPRREKTPANLAAAGQGLAELALQDPDFVLHLGDLSFGLDFQREVPEGRELLVGSRIPVFAIPGNHDGYADYVVRLRGGALALVGGALGCRRHLEGELDWGKAWVFISCVYGDVKELLYADLHRDGLVYWTRQLGPPAYAFDHGRVRFVAINTYDGTPERRHAFSIYMDAFDLKLGVPSVDNYGGYLTAEQLGFIRKEARRASARGQTLVVFGHHDPRGNSEGQPYHANEPFPTDPLSLGGFEEWNYESSRWDSDPRDARRAETAERNSGTELLAILAEHGGYYLCGHAHHDQRRVYPPGSMLGRHRVKRRLEFIRTTTASASCRNGSYWGYRMIEVAGGELRAVDYAPEHGLGSIPVGNLWVERSDKSEAELATGLPRPTAVALRLELPSTAEGHRFRFASPRKEGGERDLLAPVGTGSPTVEELMVAGSRTIFRLALTLPSASFPPSELALRRVALRAVPARGNRPPTPRIDVSSAAVLDPMRGERARPPELAWVGQPVLFSSERSRDPDGDRILVRLWDLGDGRSGRGARLATVYGGPGKRTVRLTLFDEAGARASTTRELVVENRPPPGCGGCCAPPSPGSPRRAWGLGALVALAGLLLAGTILWRRRR